MLTIPSSWRLVSSENRERFIPIIDSILTGSDLQTISEKRIRKGLQEAVGYDLTPQKVRMSGSFMRTIWEE